MENSYLLSGSKKLSWSQQEIDAIESKRDNNYDRYIVFKKFYQELTDTKNKISKIQLDYENANKNLNQDVPQIANQSTDKEISQDVRKIVGEDVNKDADGYEKSTLVDNWKDWNSVKRLTNPHELIHVPSRNLNDSIAYYLPVSRSYFKMKEIISDFNLFGNYINKDITIVCLAEGPGGFIEAITKERAEHFDRIFGFTLRGNGNIPNWRRLQYALSKIEKTIDINVHVDLQYGDIYKEGDVRKFMERVKSVASIVTADGGFDYTASFNYQEQVSYRLIFSEIMTAFHLQAPKGHLICKVFDLFSIFSMKIIYLLYCFYDKVYLYKPKTSRPANSEKYIVAKGFNGISPMWLNKLREIQNNWIDGDNTTIDLNGIVLPNDFIMSIFKFNENFVKLQTDNINQTIELIEHPLNNTQYKNILGQQIKNGIEWCKKYNENINYKSKYKSMNLYPFSLCPT
jgi:23S rRNA U2552 (ribose-2'-O)-methylase RlmE/FtsJ